MAANFWASSHCKHWLVDRPTVERARLVDARYATPKQLACLNIYFANLLQRLGKRLLLRQRPIATSIIYFRRFYLKNSFCDTDPYLVLATCSYVAAKLEETPVHIKSVVIEARQMYTELKIPIKHFPADNTKLAEMEFYLLEDLDFHLIVFHPYRSLTAICGREPMDTGWFDPPGEDESETEINLGRGTGKAAIRFDKEIFETAWFIVNDTYRTELCLSYPPYLIAIAALYLAIAHFQAAHPGRSLLSPSLQKQIANNQAQAQAQAQVHTHASLPANPTTGVIPPKPTASTTSTLKGLNHPLPMNPLLQKAQQARLATPPPGLPPNPTLASHANPQPPPSSSTTSAKSTTMPDPITYLSHLNVNFSLVAVIVQEILSLWPLWDSMEGGSSLTPGPAQGPSVAALKTAAVKGVRESTAAGEARLEGIFEGPQMVQLVESMRSEREKDRSFPDGGWPVPSARPTAVIQQQQQQLGVKRGRR